jgi:hypothetical protein
VRERERKTRRRDLDTEKEDDTHTNDSWRRSEKGRKDRKNEILGYLQHRSTGSTNHKADDRAAEVEERAWRRSRFSRLGLGLGCTITVNKRSEKGRG